MEKDKQFYIKERKSRECFCGKSKQRSFAFCYTCNQSLPRDMQRALWHDIGDGWEDAYDAAITELNGAMGG